MGRNLLAVQGGKFQGGKFPNYATGCWTCFLNDILLLLFAANLIVA